ncbi:MAG: glycosyltransferase [Thermosynechococcaceae cyanobacterium]
MKILFIGDLSSYARARQRFLAMQDLGHLVEGRSWVPLETELIPGYKPNIWQRIRRKIGYPIDTVGINQNLIPHLAEFQPNLLWIEKVITILPSTYKQIRQQFPNLNIIYYSEDDVYLFDNRSIYLKHSFPLFDTVYTTKPRNVQELPRIGAKNVVCIFQAYDRNVHRPMALSTEDRQRWGAEVGFVGFFERDRAEQMLYLAQQGIKVRIWGFNWQDWMNRHPNLIVEGTPVFNEDFVKVLNATCINLNFLRKANRDRHTSRSLEIPACEGFMLAERTDEHLQLFEEGKEAEFFNSPEELYQKVNYYLTHDTERQQIAREGRNRCIRSGYSHHDRLTVMLEKIESKPSLIFTH